MKTGLKLLITVLLALLFFSTPSKTQANQSACNPVDVKPQALGSIKIVPDIVAVGNNVIVQMPTGEGSSSRITISAPKEYFEIVDYSPKSITDGTAKAGEWVAKSGKSLPADNYDLTLKTKHFTAGKWTSINATAAVWGGIHYAHQSFFIYYDEVPIEVSLSDRNEVPQTTMDVVRKITLSTVPEVTLNITTDKGSLGKTISESSGKSLQVKADKQGKATLYLFAKEKQKVTLVASSSDSCQDSTISQSFTIKRSDVSRNVKENYSWIWWLMIILLILLIVVLFLWKRKKKQEQQKENSISNTQNESLNQSFQNSANIPQSLQDQTSQLSEIDKEQNI